MLQVIGLLKDAFQKAGLDLYLAPYGVLPTAYECGIIEVVPEASSRSALGETSDAGLYEIFQREFGAPGTDSFEVARHNFILSSAGCAPVDEAVVSMLTHASIEHGCSCGGLLGKSAQAAAWCPCLHIRPKLCACMLVLLLRRKAAYDEILDELDVNAALMSSNHGLM